MEREHFDELTRALADRSPRRRVAGLLLALGIGASGGLQSLDFEDADARKRRRRRKKRNKHRDKPAGCLPDCAGKECGPNGCGGSCGSCGSLSSCNADGHCEPVCLPDCAGAECGSDGCGGSCGTCPSPKVCFGDPGQCFLP